MTPSCRVLGSVLDYDEGLVEELRRVYGASVCTALEALTRPPSQYYFRVNRLRVEPGELLDEMRGEGFEVYMDEFWEEALWIPVRGPRVLRDPGCRVVVDKRAAESVMLGAHVYAPGVVRFEDCAVPGREVLVVSENGVPVAIGVVARGSREALEAGRGLVVENVEPLYSVPSLRETRWWREGLIYEQSVSSMTVARVLGARQSSVIVDMCAAPGGKTGHVYELVGGEARVIAVDHSRRKVERLRWEMKRLGHRVEVLRADARRLPETLGRGIADYVILDPPCTSLGVVPKVWDRKGLRDARVLARYQAQFIRAAWELLKPGGAMVYSTCTMTVVENEEVLGYAERLGFRVVEAWPRRWSRGLLGYSEAQRMHPHVHGSTGYFVARLLKPPA